LEAPGSSLGPNFVETWVFAHFASSYDLLAALAPAEEEEVNILYLDCYTTMFSPQKSSLKASVKPEATTNIFDNQLLSLMSKGSQQNLTPIPLNFSFYYF